MPRRKATRSLASVEAGLRAMYGEPPSPVPTTVFEAALWECCAYLVDDDRRAATFARLKRDIGIDPAALIAAPARQLLAAIAEGGMLPANRARKVQAAAKVALDVGVKELQRLARESPKDARRIVERFPGIGDPGADWLLLLAHGLRSVAPDSNALRVLCRLGYGQESKDYSKTYRSVTAALEPELPGSFDDCIALRQLLRRHGQETCRRTTPGCESCALASMCQYRSATR
jgi:endonuclease III